MKPHPKQFPQSNKIADVKFEMNPNPMGLHEDNVIGYNSVDKGENQ